MRLVLSWLRDFVPDIDASADQIAEKIGLRGFEVASVESLPNHPAYPDKPEAVIDFEVTANRPDCLSVMGLAREVATAFDVPYAPTHVTNGAAVESGINDRLKIGIERIAILKYQVEDIRLFYENDLRFLEQFPY